jgi:hypothetical protein
MRSGLMAIAVLALAITPKAQALDMQDLVAAPAADRVLGIWCPGPGGERWQRCTRLTFGWLEISREAVESAHERCPILARFASGSLILRCRSTDTVMTWHLTPQRDGTLTLAIGSSDADRGPPPTPPDSDLWAYDVTVLAMAPGGAWGVATEVSTAVATASAIARCRLMAVGGDTERWMTSGGTDCGAYQVTAHGGWALAFHCGREFVLVADRDLAEAERRAIAREQDMRERYQPAMPPCYRVVTVDPSGKASVSPAPIEQVKR